MVGSLAKVKKNQATQNSCQCTPWFLKQSPFNFHFMSAFEISSLKLSQMSFLILSKFKAVNFYSFKGIQTHNHLVRKRTPNHLAKLTNLARWLSVSLQTEWLSVQIPFCHLNVRCSTCYEQGVPWQSGNYRLQIHSETRTWHDNNIQLTSIAPENVRNS